jgi:hypothetical protein
MTEQQTTTLKSYAILMSDFVEGKLSPQMFESAYLRKFKNEQTMLPESAFSVLDRLFGDVDAYVAEPSIRGTDGLGDKELLAATKVALSELLEII